MSGAHVSLQDVYRTYRKDKPMNRLLRERLNSGKYILQQTRRPKDAPLTPNHLHRRLPQAFPGRCGPILNKNTIKPPIIRLPHRRMHTHVRRDAREHQIPDPADAQQQLEVRVREGAAARLVDHGFVGKRVQLGDRVVALFAADEEAAEGAWVADSQA